MKKSDDIYRISEWNGALLWHGAIRQRLLAPAAREPAWSTAVSGRPTHTHSSTFTCAHLPYPVFHYQNCYLGLLTFANLCFNQCRQTCTSLFTVHSEAFCWNSSPAIKVVSTCWTRQAVRSESRVSVIHKTTGFDSHNSWGHNSLLLLKASIFT